jgi:hypothetical protein
MNTQQPASKPLYESALYAVIKRPSGSFAVVLKSNANCVQYSGGRNWCIDWAKENDGGLEE